MNPPPVRRLPVTLLFLAAALWPGILSAGLIPHPFSSSLTLSSTSQFQSIIINNDGAPLGSRVYYGTLDITNNCVIVTQTTEAGALSTFANIVDMVRSGYGSNHNWGGTGIMSSTAKLDHDEGYGITAVGVILNDDGEQDHADGSGEPIYNTWQGIAVSQYDVLVKFTFFGDTLLSGTVSGSDAGVVNGNLGTGKGWVNGEFNYTGGVVNSHDIYEVNHSLARESQYPLETPVAPDPPFVPEPGTLLLAACGIVGLLAYSRRSRHPNPSLRWDNNGDGLPLCSEKEDAACPLSGRKLSYGRPGRRRKTGRRPSRSKAISPPTRLSSECRHKRPRRCRLRGRC